MEYLNSCSTKFTSSPGVSNNDTQNASDPDVSCVSQTDTLSASDPDDCCAPNNDTTNSSDPEDSCSSNNDTTNASDPDDSCAPNNDTPNASDPEDSCSSNNDTPNASDPDDFCASNNDTPDASDPNYCCASNNDTTNASDPDDCCAPNNDTPDASDPDDSCASQTAKKEDLLNLMRRPNDFISILMNSNDSITEEQEKMITRLQELKNKFDKGIVSKEWYAELNRITNDIDEMNEKKEDLYNLLKRPIDFIITNSKDSLAEVKEKMKTYLQELQNKFDKGIVPKEWYLELNRITSDIDELNERYSNSISTLEQLKNEHLKIGKQYLAKLGYKDKKIECSEPISKKIDICRLMHKTPFCEKCGWRYSWIKSFRKRGVYVKEAAQGTDKHIWYNNIKDK